MSKQAIMALVAASMLGMSSVAIAQSETGGVGAGGAGSGAGGAGAGAGAAGAAAGAAGVGGVSSTLVLSAMAVGAGLAVVAGANNGGGTPATTPPATTPRP